MIMLAIKKGDIAKVTRMTDKGLDPNFIDLESGGGELQCQGSTLFGNYTTAIKLLESCT